MRCPDSVEWSAIEPGVALISLTGETVRERCPACEVVCTHDVLENDDRQCHICGEFWGREADASLVLMIRRVCARELNEPPSFPFFHADYFVGESPDAALLRLFRAERPNNSSDKETIMVLCHG
jgi:hypothetical protein